ASTQVLRPFSSTNVLTMAFSPDSRRLAWCTDARDVYLWDLKESEPTFFGKGNRVAFSPSGEILATAAPAAHSILLWNVLRREKVDELRGHGGLPLALAF